MAIKNSIYVVLGKIRESINLSEKDIATVVSSISQIHLFDDVLDFRQ